MNDFNLPGCYFFLSFFLLSVDFGRNLIRKDAKLLVNISKYTVFAVLNRDFHTRPFCFFNFKVFFPHPLPICHSVHS
uniref:Uncharacterized protein n=1 Tax=Poecilia latipinna TaxID=48699 RepID=A0A3B3TJH5_9TELE